MTAVILSPAPSDSRNGAAGGALAWSSVTLDVAGHRRHLLAVSSAVGLCAVRIGHDPEALRAEVDREFAGLIASADDRVPAPWLDDLATLAQGQPTSTAPPTDLRGTDFQRTVWSALVTIPRGQTRTYAAVAAQIGQPSAVRAVARACALNPVALAVPCHRVVRTDGTPSGYRWGLELKAALLEAEGRASL